MIIKRELFINAFNIYNIGLENGVLIEDDDTRNKINTGGKHE